MSMTRSISQTIHLRDVTDQEVLRMASSLACKSLELGNCVDVTYSISAENAVQLKRLHDFLILMEHAEGANARADFRSDVQHMLLGLKREIAKIEDVLYA